jgi:serine/threonine protein kinase
MDELEIHKSLDHPDIVKMYGYFTVFAEADDTSEESPTYYKYLVLEFCPVTLQDIMDDGRIPEPRASRILAKVMDSLDYLHRKEIIHRDIKPANILVTENGEAKLADFGISTVCLTQSRRDTLVGTPPCMAPEALTVKIKKCLRNKGYDFKVDSWSLGILMYRMLTGEHPYQEEYTAMSLDNDELREKFASKSPPPIDFPDFISKDAKNLILSLLQVYPGSRMSVKEARNHPWIQNSAGTTK